MDTPAHFICALVPTLTNIPPAVSAYADKFTKDYDALPISALEAAIWEAADGSLGSEAQKWAASHGVEF
jgi:hypothetical protein